MMAMRTMPSSEGAAAMAAAAVAEVGRPSNSTDGLMACEAAFTAAEAAEAEAKAAEAEDAEYKSADCALE